MKRCSKCRRDYFDDSLMYCLDDGARLLEGPAPEATPTAIMPRATPSGEAATRTFNNEQTTNESFPATSNRKVFGIIAGAVVLVALLGWAGYTFYGRGSSRQVESIAVMPFVNTGGNPDFEYLSDGLTESLINSLSGIPTLSVKARSSVFTYKGKDVSPQQVASDLSVQAVLNGRVQQRGDQVVLNVELVDTATGNQLWGDQYIRQVTDLVRLQSDMARDISGKLREKLTGVEQRKVAKNYTESTEAYQLYLRGRHHWNRRTRDDIRKSIEYFQQAIDKDPSYALAYAAMAEAYILVSTYRLGTPRESYPMARAAASRAIEIDDSLAEAHNALATVVSNYDWKFADAEAEWRKAIALNPNYASAHQWYAEFLLTMRRYPEALTEMRRAQELDPLSLIINGMVGIALHLNGHNDQALEQLNKTLEMDPNFPRTHLFLAGIYQRMGRFDDASDEFAKHFVLNGGSPDEAARLTVWVKNAGRTGGEKGHFRAMAELMEKSNNVPPAIRASYWARAGEPEKAFPILEKAYQDRDDSLLQLTDYRFEPIKDDPRYKDLLRRVGLPE